MRVLVVQGAESERRLGFAALHRLLLPQLDRLAELSTPQSAALGILSGPPSDRSMVGLGTITLLAAVAVDRPLLCIVDDAQWSDPESLQVLAFVARRQQVDGMRLLIALRAGDATGAVALQEVGRTALALLGDLPPGPGNRDRLLDELLRCGDRSG